MNLSLTVVYFSSKYKKFNTTY